MSGPAIGPVNGLVNGVRTASLAAVVSRFRQDPSSADTPFAVSVDWLEGYRTEATLGLHGPLAGDEPLELAGEGSAPAPEELLLAAAAQCLVVGIVGTASARAIAVHSLHVRARGTVDLAVAYGLADGHAGFSSVTLEVDLDAHADREVTESIVAEALDRAPIPSSLAHPIPVTAVLT